MNQQETRREEIERLWRDPESRKGWGVISIYYQPKDPRVVVPKHYGFGWTINFAHPSVIPSILLSIALVTLPTLLAMALVIMFRLNLLNAIIIVAIVEIVSIVWLCAWCSRLSSRYD